MVVNIALRIWLPGESPARVPWLVPSIEVILILALIMGNPTSRAEHRRLRRFAVFIVGVLLAAALWATALLIRDMIKGVGLVNHADQLLATGAVVWLGRAHVCPPVT